MSLAPRLTPAEGFIGFDRSAIETVQHIRAFTSNPGAWTLLPDTRRMKLFHACCVDEEEKPTDLPTTPVPGTVHVGRQDVYVACPDAWVRLGQVAPAGKGWMDAPAWARGARLEHGARLGASNEHDGEDE